MKFLDVDNLPKSLPPTPYDSKDSPIWYKAYEKCIAGEANIILNKCKQDDTLALLGMRLFHFVLQRMIRVIEANNEFGYVILPGLLIPKQQNQTLYSEVTKRSALHCEISAAFERDEYRQRMRGVKAKDRGGYVETSYLEIARLIPPYSNVTLLDTNEIIKDNSTENEEQEFKLFEFIKGYGGFEMEPLIPPTTNPAQTPLSNALAIAQFDIFRAFGCMRIWLEPLSIQQDSQTYHVYGRGDCGCPSLNMLPDDYITTIKSRDPDRTYELPDPRYIALHAAFSRALHKSGMWSEKGDVGPPPAVLYNSIAAIAQKCQNA
ncbi:hypothetical protein CVT24_003263 [Panaeolus cyanescens]|uniref:Uncharacterized protein n=1 Tax=Panaeolus cyanescens TaxID=181874 RepID=A0A409YXJ8_9AGAR|nr:hypothetical protein CVT24_003263 [Panaeolus cyanescens]